MPVVSTRETSPQLAPDEIERRARASAESATRHARLITDRRALDLSRDELWARLSESPLEPIAALSHDDHQLRVLSHTLDLNDLAVAHVLNHVDNTLQLAYAIAFLTQRALHTFVDPSDDRVTRNLAGAKRAGTFFTPPAVAIEMAEYALENRSEIAVLLEPASGTGMLTAALLTEAASRGVEVQDAHAWELSPYLAKLTAQVTSTVIEREGLSTRLHVESSDALERFDSAEIRPDIVIMNPPYGRVKYLRSEATNTETKASNVSAAVRAGHDWVNSTRGRYELFARKLGLRERGLDHQKMFIAAGLNALANGGRMACIAPSSWTSGPQSSDLREILIRPRHLERIVLFREDAKLFPTVNQPTAIIVADEIGGHSAIKVGMHTDSSLPRIEYDVRYSEIMHPVGKNLSIPMIRPELRGAFEKISGLPPLSELPLKNARGELDLTADSWMITEHSTGVRVIRGDHVERYVLRDAEKSTKRGSVSLEGREALSKRPKWADTHQPRIVGRQVAYMGKARRLTFSLSRAGDVISNSCNYLAIEDATLRMGVLGYLNSAPAEWAFRLHNSNNHVSNAELSALPWPLRQDQPLRAVAASTEIRLKFSGHVGNRIAQRAEDIIDATVCFGMGMSSQTARPVLELTLGEQRVEAILSLLELFHREGIPAHLLSKETWFQHGLNTLSKLDYEMIRHVPIGGNWQNIPESVPSERLKQIRAMSADRGIVRTTYYGRLRPDQPSYTIATYYNRPGNGTNIHPYEDRTLSHREAARLQSFPDSYGFLGGEGAVRTQIGNAVPPLLGLAVAKRLIDSGVGRGPTIDLFAGAGGLSLGFEMAGLSVAAAADNNEAALRTYAFNHPTEAMADPSSRRSLLIGADLSDSKQREDAYAAIRQKLGGARPSILAGGPPCQGFSYAGFRDPNDRRSDLAVAFLDFVEALQPHAVVLENVEGLLTAKGGSVARDLLTTLEELGYPVASPWVLAAEQFGVPQMRRRVFLVAKRGESVSEPAPLFDRCLGRREVPNIAKSARYPISVSEALFGLPQILESKQIPDSGRVEFSEWASGSVDAVFVPHAAGEE